MKSTDTPPPSTWHPRGDGLFFLWAEKSAGAPARRGGAGESAEEPDDVAEMPRSPSEHAAPSSLPPTGARDATPRGQTATISMEPAAAAAAAGKARLRRAARVAS